MARATQIVSLALAFAAAAGPAAASDSFCDPLIRAVAAAPAFVSLRGAMTGSEFDGNLIIWEADQCNIRNKSPELATPLDSPQARWSYECLYEMRTPEALGALQSLIASCLPDARYQAGSQFRNEPGGANYDGGIFTIGANRIAIDFNKTTNSVWMIILPPGVNY